jgi:gluconokinase
MPAVPGLRSNYDKTGPLVYFGRMLDKIRLHTAGKLPPDYVANLGKGFDLRCCTFLRVTYADLQARTLAGGTDTDVLAWAFTKGGARSDDECVWWNTFMMKRGWRDEAAPILAQRIKEFGLEGKPIETMFDLNEFDEGRDPVAIKAWAASK